MNHASHNKLVSFIWSIADDCLRDVYVRGKYRDVILPMVVLRRLDTLLEPGKEIIDKFKLKAQVRHMAGKDVLLDVLEKFTSPTINLTNLGMGHCVVCIVESHGELR